MLVWLGISDFAIIDRAELEFTPGLNVLTGETGAGKSILIDALGGILGERLGPDFIRPGADRTRIEAVFNIRPLDQLRPVFAEAGIELTGDELIISREITSSGRNTARVNGAMTPVATLQRIGAELADIHGQSQHLSLLRTPVHLRLLDAYAGLTEKRADFGRLVDELRRVEREIADLERSAREAERRIDLLRYQIDEINRASLVVGEDSELLAEHNRLVNAEALSTGADAAYKLLSSDEERSALELVGEAINQLSALKHYDRSVEQQMTALEAILYQLEDVARWLRSYRDEIEFNPDRLAQIEERLHLIQSLKRKYGDLIEEVLAYSNSAASELETLLHREERSSRLENERDSLRRRLAKLASELSSGRQMAAEQLALAINQELADLALAGASFVVNIQQRDDPQGLLLDDGRPVAFDSTGIDQVEFHVSMNPGSPLRPLIRVASGGETSRLMLALKSVLARTAGVPVQVFDEIDAGVGGRAGWVVGEKLWKLAQQRQLICVTHLPQIACFASRHFLIAKSQDESSSVTSVTTLEGERRVRELAAMLSGVSDSATAQQNAQDMIERAEDWKRDQLASVQRK